MKFICEECQFTAAESEFKSAMHLNQRIEPGGIFTNVECPHCGALAYPETMGRTVTVIFAEPNDRSVFLSYMRRAKAEQGTVTGLYAGLMTSILKRATIKE